MHTHRNLASFSQVCTSLYMGAMCILYRRVFWLPSLWYLLIDSIASLGYPFSDMVAVNPRLLLFVLKLQYNKKTLSNQPESVIAYKFRRFLFATAQVRALNLDNIDFSPVVLEFVKSLLPNGRATLLPGLRTASWIDDEYLIPAFLSAPVDDDSWAPSLISDTLLEFEGPTGDAEPRGSWLPFNATTVRTVNLQMHTLVTPMDPRANHDLFFGNIQQLRNQCLRVFPYLDRILFLVCRHQYNKPTLLSRTVVNVIGSLVLGTSAVPLSANIPQPPHTLPYRKEQVLGGGLFEGIAINGYLSHTPLPDSSGDAAMGVTPSNPYPMVSAHLITSTSILAVACTTNMSPSSISEKHTICRILYPAIEFLGLETLILHLDTVSLRLSHSDLAFIGSKWRNIRILDLRFKTVVTNEFLDIIQPGSLQNLTKSGSADRLKHVHLPELDVRTFANIQNHCQDALTTLTSSVLYFDENRVEDVCIELLSAYPNLTKVTGPGSAPEWNRFAKVLASVLEKHRKECNDLDKRIRADAAYLQRQLREGRR